MRRLMILVLCVCVILAFGGSASARDEYDPFSISCRNRKAILVARAAQYGGKPAIRFFCRPGLKESARPRGGIRLELGKGPLGYCYWPLHPTFIVESRGWAYLYCGPAPAWNDAVPLVIE